MRLDEETFEAEIAGWLTEHGGYTAGTPAFFDRALGIDTAELLAFIGATQAREWERLQRLYLGSA